MNWIALFKLLTSLPTRALSALDDRLARAAYRAYGATTGFKNYQGNPMPEWPALTDTIRSAWRAAARAAFVVGLASGLVLGFLGALIHLGAHRTPAQPNAASRVVERVETKATETTRAQVETRSAQVEIKQTAQVRRVTVRRAKTTSPDGTVRERAIETSEAVLVDRAQLVNLTHAAIEFAQTKQIEQAAERTVDPRRDWRAGVFVGVAIDGPRPVFGLHVERRVLGPASAGVWFLNSGAVGASLSVEF